MKKLFVITSLVCVLPCVLPAQDVTTEKVEAYMQPLKTAYEKVSDAFKRFDAAAHKNDITAIKSAMLNFQNEAASFDILADNTTAQYGDIWFLPKTKDLGKEVVAIGKYDIPRLVEAMEKGSTPGKLEDLYLFATRRLDEARSNAYWGEANLVAHKFYKKTGEAFCYSSNLLIEETRTNFKRLNAGPVAGKNDVWKVTSLPVGASEGEIKIILYDTTARFVMFRSEDKQEAQTAFDNLIYVVLSCDHKNMRISSNVTSSEPPERRVAPYFIYSEPGHDGVSIKITFTSDNKGWVIYIDYRIGRHDLYG